MAFVPVLRKRKGRSRKWGRDRKTGTEVRETRLISPYKMLKTLNGSKEYETKIKKVNLKRKDGPSEKETNFWADFTLGDKYQYK